MHILLINPPDEMELMLGVGKAFVQKYEPLGLLYVAAHLRDHGHRVSAIDAYAEELDADAILHRIGQISPDVVGFSVLTCNGALVYGLGRSLKERHPGMRVVLGNIHAAVYAREYLAEGCADVIVHGEGEEVTRLLLEAWENGHDLSKIPSISYLDPEGSVQQNVGQAVIDDLSKLALPARDLVRQELYGLTPISNQNFVTDDGGRAKTMVTSRGCPHHCTFCIVHGNRKARYNDPMRVVDEMELLEREYSANYVYIQDPLFAGHRRRAREICEEITRRGLTLKWGCDVHVNYVTRELVETFARANCYELSLGIESGVQRLLDVVGKGTTLERIRQAAQLLRDHSDIRTEGLFILGIPSETRQESLTTIRFATELPLDMAQFSIFTPYPGSPVFDELRAEGAIDTGIRPGDRLDPSVWHRYSSYICFNDLAPIWVTDTLTMEQLRALQKMALRRFYLRPRQIWDQLKRVRPSNIGSLVRIAWSGFV